MKVELQKLVDLIQQTQEKDISCYSESFLAQILEQRIISTSSLSASQYLALLSSDKTERVELLRSLRINYSDFFRYPLVFDLLEFHVIPQLIAKKNGKSELRIWSVGCAQGQEPYSIAIILNDYGRQSGKPVQARIFATDIAEADLEFARKGIYQSESLRNVRLCHLRHYFTQDGDNFIILPQLMNSIDFSIFNILDTRFTCPPASIYGEFDLIFCCNLLYYYNLDIQQHILNRICRALSPSGYLIIGETEKAIIEKRVGFTPVSLPALIYRITNDYPLHEGGNTHFTSDPMV